MYIESLRSLSSAHAKNGGKNKIVEFIILFSLYMYASCVNVLCLNTFSAIPFKRSMYCFAVFFLFLSLSERNCEYV